VIHLFGSVVGRGASTGQEIWGSPHSGAGSGNPPKEHPKVENQTPKNSHIHIQDKTSKNEKGFGEIYCDEMPTLCQFAKRDPKSQDSTYSILFAFPHDFDSPATRFFRSSDLPIPDQK
jgi:hypothetical protein